MRARPSHSRSIRWNRAIRLEFSSCGVFTFELFPGVLCRNLPLVTSLTKCNNSVKLNIAAMWCCVLFFDYWLFVCLLIIFL